MLEDTYEDERLIIDTHIDALMSLPKINKESGDELRNLIDTCIKHTEALKNHKLPVSGLAEMIIVNLIAKRMDKETRKLWETQLPSDELPSFTDMMEFLRERCRVLQKVRDCTDRHAVTDALKQRAKLERRNAPAKNFVQTTKEICPCCNNEHSIYKCEKFKQLNIPDRYSKVKQAGMCYNCLRRGHRTADCKSGQLCKLCNKKHHSFLHEERSQSVRIPSHNPVDQSTSKQIEIEDTPVQSHASVNCTQTHIKPKQILLSTASILVCGSGNSNWPCRALLDSASDSNIISEELANKLKMKYRNINIPISGLNGAETQAKYKIRTKIISRVNQFEAILDFLVVPKITTNLPIVEVDIKSMTIPGGIALADPCFHIPDEIQMIIGAELFFDLLKDGRIKLANENPTLIETRLGWIVSGPVYSDSQQRSICQVNVSNEELNQMLTKFWEIDACPEATTLNETEKAVEMHFEQTYTRDDQGRYTVRLPFNHSKQQLGDSLQNAKARFEKLLRTFSNDTKRMRYSEFMTEYLSLGHMVEVCDNPSDGYFLPHHAVYKESSSTTKIRVVFDASAKSTSGLSLNDTLMVGPTIQSDLLSIILRFCCHQVVLTADIPKMYRQVRIHEDDRKYQRILWLNSENKPSIFELTTVTYGCSSAPYLATRALFQLADDEADKLPLASMVIKQHSYVDDFLTGGNTVEEVIEIYKQLSEILRRGGFGVHKFCTNSDSVREYIPAELLETQFQFENVDINNTIKTLGIVWNPTEDYFLFRVNSPGKKNCTMTKRNVLSEIGRLFDPLGLLGPIITTAKLLMQNLWRLGIDWDEALSPELHSDWMTFRGQLPLINSIRKKRCVVMNNSRRIELHGFSDASKSAFGAVLYLRCISTDGDVNVELLSSKSRVAPLKPITIPRLELCGALLLAQLVKKVTSAMTVSFHSVTLWCDSQIVLCWLRKSPLSLNQFVANRVATIIDLTHGYRWRYIRSAENPADVLSRGILPEDLIQNEMWWKGSPIMWCSIPESDIHDVNLQDAEIPEIKTKVLINIQPTPAIDFTRVSNFRRLHRAWAYVTRFLKNVSKKNRDTSLLSAHEMSESLYTIVKLVQKESFSELFKILSDGSLKRSNYSGLAPFIDSNGIIRVGGRLKYSSIPYDGKHQMLLPEKHHVTRILVKQLHEDNFHVGQRGLLSIVRAKFWPIRAKSLIKQTINTCYVCCRYNPKPINQYMGNLPDHRITPSPVFSNTGVDYAGPIMLKEGKRKLQLYKAYIVVFICLTTKAIHFELVSNLTTENFIAALQRFISRRGMVNNMYSDNGTTFIGSHHELAMLKELFENQAHQMKMNDFCIGKGIQWHFIPPRSPHFGGIWEAGVKSAKHHLKRVVGETKLTYEEMLTFLAQAEAILNSRPLIPISDDPNDVEALTPSHFLIGRSALSIPEPSYAEVKIGRLNRWQHIQLMKEHFWKRWSGEYLHELQSRTKWHKDVTKIEIGSLVVLKDDNVPPNQWRLGRITAIHPGKDNIVRVVTVRTATGEYRRAVAKICLLPLVDSVESTGGECCVRN